MENYYAIIEVIYQVLNGKNLSSEFNNNIDKSLNVAKIKDITFGVFRYYNELSLIYNVLVPKSNDNKLKAIILVGIYEINYSNKVEYAITNDLVTITDKLFRNIKLKNFVNAVLRNYLRNQNELKNKLSRNTEYSYNFPQWMINKLKTYYPSNYIDIIYSLNLKPKLSIRINPRKINKVDYLKLLDKEEILYQEINKAIYLNEVSNPSRLPYFKDGYVSIQDIHAQELINFVDIKAGSRILDACSAPGGKACQILENNAVSLTCLDIDNSRLDKLRQNLIRLDLSASLICADATKNNWWDKEQYDLIIADVPCSASGTIKKNPDIKYIRKEEDIINFVRLQRSIVDNLWTMLKSKSELIYITCSIFKEENKQNIEYFCNKYSNMKLVDEKIMLPTDYADGFYYAKLLKV